MKHEGFASRLGFILVSAGCAIGIGNVWRFPTVTGENGGGVFVLFYLLFLLLLGVPVLTMELAVGRAGRSPAVDAYKKLEPKGSRWHLHGWVCLLGCTLLMMYYTTVNGWMISYFTKFVSGQFNGLDTEQVGSMFSALLANPMEMGLWMVVTVVVGFFVCSFGLQKGVERITKWMMCALLVLILVLVGHSLTLTGAKEGLSFYLLPDWNRAVTQGLGKVIGAAMNQAFFTLSLGVAAMEIFGSYMSDSHTLTSESIRICLLDTFVAICSGLIIFPACYSFHIAPDQGPMLLFVTLPNVFLDMNGGRLWGSLFFLFMMFASFSTVIAVFENILSNVMQATGFSRRRAAIVCGSALLILSLPCVLGFNVWSSLNFLGRGSVLDGEDFLVSNLLLPLGSLVFLLFCVTRKGWGFDNYLAEANKGHGIRMARWMKPYLQIVVPILILVVLIQGLL